MTFFTNNGDRRLEFTVADDYVKQYADECVKDGLYKDLEDFLESMNPDVASWLYYWADKDGAIISIKEGNVSDIITDEMEIIWGQDHTYWVYDNERNAYYPTDVSWNRVTEEQFIESFNKIGFEAYGYKWIPESEMPFDV